MVLDQQYQSQMGACQKQSRATPTSLRISNLASSLGDLFWLGGSTHRDENCRSSRGKGEWWDHSFGCGEFGCLWNTQGRWHTAVGCMDLENEKSGWEMQFSIIILLVLVAMIWPEFLGICSGKVYPFGQSEGSAERPKKHHYLRHIQQKVLHKKQKDLPVV